MKTLLLFYRRVISPFIHTAFGAHAGCRFHPTCSQFAEESLNRFGAVRGSGLLIWRVMRCHPFSRGGYDPVPQRETPTPAFFKTEER